MSAVQLFLIFKPFIVIACTLVASPASSFPLANMVYSFVCFCTSFSMGPSEQRGNHVRSGVLLEPGVLVNFSVPGAVKLIPVTVVGSEAPCSYAQSLC